MTTSEIFNTFILHYKRDHPLCTIKILILKQNESAVLMGCHVMNSEITPETIGNRDVTFGDDLVLREVIPVGIDGELLSPHMNKPGFMSTPIQSHDADLHLDT